jgi:uncharacterized protein with PIN domain
MAETQVQKKKRKKQQLSALEQVQEETAIQNASEVTQALEELKEQGVRLDIQVCPRCKSPLLQRVGSMAGDMFSHMGFTPPIYECRECGWRERTVLKATNKPTTVKDVVIMAEAKDIDFERKRKEKKQ